ncbi:MAG: flagellar biosynthesis protein FliQ [Lachnospirales bacterium]
MTSESVLDVIRLALNVIILTSMPPLLVGLSLGIIVSIFQAVTSIQEPTLAFVPKIIGVLFAIIFFGTYMQSNITGLFQTIYTSIPEFISYR